MTADEFDTLLIRRLGLTRMVLTSKAGEYASEADRLHNFKRAGERRGKDPADALLGMLVKHWISVEDLVAANLRGQVVTQAQADEKIGDAINYLILLEAVLRERR